MYSKQICPGRFEAESFLGDWSNYNASFSPVTWSRGKIDVNKMLIPCHCHQCQEHRTPPPFVSQYVPYTFELFIALFWSPEDRPREEERRLGRITGLTEDLAPIQGNQTRNWLFQGKGHGNHYLIGLKLECQYEAETQEPHILNWVHDSMCLSRLAQLMWPSVFQNKGSVGGSQMW